MMQIKFGGDGYVEGYAEIGGMQGAIEYTGEIPADFGPETCRCYQLVDGVLIRDDDRLERAQRRQGAAERLLYLHNAIAATDYKIIKTSEYNLVGLDPPYDIATLHAERQAIRDEINELEAKAK